MADIRIAAGIIAWQDGAECLTETIRSIAGVVDETIIADGPIAGMERNGLAAFTPDLPGGGAFIMRNREWASQSAKRNVILELARIRRIDWLLTIDADEKLHNGIWLRRHLEMSKLDAYSIPFFFDRDTATGAGAAWKLLRVNAWRRYSAMGHIVEHSDGTVYNLVSPVPPRASVKETGLPWLSHHPYLRPPARRDIARLSVDELRLEPVPAGVVDWPY